MNRRLRRLSVLTLMVCGAALLAPEVALASCPPLDAVCLAEEALGDGEGTVEDTLDPVDPVVETAGPVVEDTVDTVEGVLNDPPGGGGGGSHDRPGGKGPSGPGRSGGAGSDAGLPTGPDLAGRGLGRSRLQPSATVTESAGPVGRVRREPSLGERIAEAIGGAARSLTLVMALLSLATGFVLIQNHLDRKDPRLALAPIESDLVTFA